MKDKIYERYLEAFRRGVYNMIKKEYDKVSQTQVARKYFSGGTSMDFPVEKTNDRDMLSEAWQKTTAGQLVHLHSGMQMPGGKDTKSPGPATKIGGQDTSKIGRDVPVEGINELIKLAEEEIRADQDLSAVDLNELLVDFVENEYKDFSADYGRLPKVKRRVEGNGFYLRSGIDRKEVTKVIRELLKDAIRHREGGDIDLLLLRRNNEIELRITNDGPIRFDDLRKILRNAAGKTCERSRVVRLGDDIFLRDTWQKSGETIGQLLNKKDVAELSQEELLSVFLLSSRLDDLLYNGQGQHTLKKVIEGDWGGSYQLETDGKRTTATMTLPAKGKADRAMLTATFTTSKGEQLRIQRKGDVLYFMDSKGADIGNIKFFVKKNNTCDLKRIQINKVSNQDQGYMKEMLDAYFVFVSQTGSGKYKFAVPMAFDPFLAKTLKKRFGFAAERKSVLSGLWYVVGERAGTGKMPIYFPDSQYLLINRDLLSRPRLTIMIKS